MSSETFWIILVLAIAAAGLAGFFLGRGTAPGKVKVNELEKQLEEDRRNIAEYRESVEQHFQKTASLFTNMAGSYRELYDHLRESYGNLTEGPKQPLLPERPGALLEGARTTPKSEASKTPESADSGEKGDGTSEQKTDKESPSDTQTHSDDMMGDAPHIPRDVDLEEPPETPVKANKDERVSASADQPSDKPGPETAPENETSVAKQAEPDTDKRG